MILGTANVALYAPSSPSLWLALWLNRVAAPIAVTSSSTDLGFVHAHLSWIRRTNIRRANFPFPGRAEVGCYTGEFVVGKWCDGQDDAVEAVKDGV